MFHKKKVQINKRDKGVISTPKNLKISSWRERGFTLIEMMVAITVLLISITGPLTLAQKGIESSRLAKNQITAFYLAQDAIEFIRNKRDSNLLNSSAWLDGLNPCVNNKCRIETRYDSGNIASCSAQGCDKLRKLNGIYGYNFDPKYETEFIRNIFIDKINSYEIIIDVEIIWDNGKKNFIIRENLFEIF